MFSPFRGLVFNPGQMAEPVQSEPAPPTGEPPRQRYLEEANLQVTRLLLGGRDHGRYQEAAALLLAWREQLVLERDLTPRFYLYRMTYGDREAGGREARGVLGALELHELGGRVRPHEETMEHLEATRMAVLETMQTNLEPIMALTPATELLDLLEEEGTLRLEFESGGVLHSINDINDPETMQAITAAVSAHPLALADGHHRYATALAYRNQRRRIDGSGPWDSIMAFVATTEGSGLEVGPIHRGFRIVEPDPELIAGSFETAGSDGSPPSDHGDLTLVPGSAHGGGPLLLRPDPESLEGLPEPWRSGSSAVAREILYPILGATEADASYFPDLEDGRAWLERHPQGALVLTAPVTERAIGDACEAGLRFPQKSTFFTPKPAAGLVLRPFED